MNWKAARTSAGLSLLFLLIYGGSNWLTAYRHHIGSYYFAWEKQIPFLPWMILPYMSIDLFFIAAPFLCRTDDERKTLTRRIIAAIVIAGACFLLMPLRFAFNRPHVEGVLGILFNNFRLLDQPYNQFPSLHIALLFILAPVYTQRSKFWWVWFSLIGLSTVLTYQHHVIDIVGGSALAVVCCYVFRPTLLAASRRDELCVPGRPKNRPFVTPLKGNSAVGIRYLIGSLLVIAIALLLRPIGFLLLWPAASLAIVAAGYFGLGASIYRKSTGQLPLVTNLLLWPTLLGQHISLLHYRRQCDPWNVLTDRIWIGRMLSAVEATKAVHAGVTAVLDLTGEFSECEVFRKLRYMQLAVLDLTAPTRDELNAAIDFIDSSTGIVYIHCKVGYSRTAAVAGCYLLTSGAVDSADQAIAMLRSTRPPIVIRPEAGRAIHNFRSTGVPPIESHPRNADATYRTADNCQAAAD